MTLSRIAVAAAFGLVATASFAQADSTCIIAGRINSDGQWAPRMAGVQLLSSDGKVVTSADKAALANVKQAKISSPALLSKCDGDAAIAQGPDAAGAKQAVPSLRAGVVTVESVSYPKFGRAGLLVELKVTAPAERVAMVTR